MATKKLKTRFEELDTFTVTSSVKGEEPYIVSVSDLRTNDFDSINETIKDILWKLEELKDENERLKKEIEDIKKMGFSSTYPLARDEETIEIIPIKRKYKSVSPLPF